MHFEMPTRLHGDMAYRRTASRITNRNAVKNANRFANRNAYKYGGHIKFANRNGYKSGGDIKFATCCTGVLIHELFAIYCPFLCNFYH